LSVKELAGLGYDMNDRKSKRMVGMVRMGNNVGAKTSSTYLTFRTLSEKSKGWIIPEKQGLGVAKAVADWLTEIYPSVLDYALELDAEQLKKLAGA
jgi:hypothetical protein